jgi:hypothetical protein
VCGDVVVTVALPCLACKCERKAGVGHDGRSRPGRLVIRCWWSQLVARDVVVSRVGWVSVCAWLECWS